MKSDYYKTKESVQEYIQLAKDINGAALIEKYKPHLKPDAKLLEIGSGPGSDWEILDKEYDVIGSDNSKEFIKHLNSKFPKGEFNELDAVSLTTDFKFDGIYSNKVLQHLTNEELIQSFRNQQKILNTKGVICHSFWKGEDDEIFKGLYVNYQNEKSLQTFVQEQFEIILIETYKEFDEGDSLLLIARKR